MFDQETHREYPLPLVSDVPTGAMLSFRETDSSNVTEIVLPLLKADALPEERMAADVRDTSANRGLVTRLKAD